MQFGTWHIDIFPIFTHIVGKNAAEAFQRQHAQAISVKRTAAKPKPARSAPLISDDGETHAKKRSRKRGAVR
jgi:hypothetical protein